MLDSKGFNLWANGYDKSVNLSEENNEPICRLQGCIKLYL